MQAFLFCGVGAVSSATPLPFLGARSLMPGCLVVLFDSTLVFCGLEKKVMRHKRVLPQQVNECVVGEWLFFFFVVWVPLDPPRKKSDFCPVIFTRTQREYCAGCVHTPV